MAAQLLRVRLMTVAGYGSPLTRTRCWEAWQWGPRASPRLRAMVAARVLGLGVLHVKIRVI
jgi:hypothetical protein